MEKFSKSRCLVVLWFNDTHGLRSLVFAVISCSDSDLQDVDGISMFNTKGRTLTIFYLILSCLNYFSPFLYFFFHLTSQSELSLMPGIIQSPFSAIFHHSHHPFLHFLEYSNRSSALLSHSFPLCLLQFASHCDQKKHMLDHLCSTLCLAKEEHSPTSYTFPFLHSCSLYALYPVGLQSPVFDQSGASMTCSCVYCQHRPVLGQLGEQEKARQ